MISVETAAQLLGGEARGNMITCAGPNHSASDRSLRVTISVDDFVVFSFAGDDFRVCRDYVKHRLGLPTNWKPEAGSFDIKPVDPQADEKILRLALRIWDNAGHIRGSLAEKYLRSRHCYVPDAKSLRFTSSCYYAKNDYRPAMIALFTDILTGKPIGIHRTYLNPDGTKLDKKMLGKHLGGAIMLDIPTISGREITVGEGIETTLSGIVMGYKPAWAMGSLANLKLFPDNTRFKSMTVLLENDKKNQSINAVKDMAKRLKQNDMKISGRKPKHGEDMNDELKFLMESR